MNRYDLIALDLDGTLIPKTLVISKRSLETLAHVAARGIALSIVTGRMFAAARPFARAIGAVGPIVCYQGAAIFDVASGARLEHTPLPRSTTLDALDVARRSGVTALGYDDDQLVAEHIDSSVRQYTELAGVEARAVGSLPHYFATRTSTKLVCVIDPRRAEHLITEFRIALGERAYITRSNPEYVEVVDVNVDKGRALATVAGRYGTTLERTLAVGDSWNDVPLLRSAGFSVAMGTAPPELRAVADAIVASAEDDGVAEAMERYVLSRALA